MGVCTKCKGKLVLTISKKSIQKYMREIRLRTWRTGTTLDSYIKQTLQLIRQEIDTVFAEKRSAADIAQATGEPVKVYVNRLA